MNVPSANDVLYAIEQSLEEIVRPALDTTRPVSCLATVSHMLRHVALRIEHEGQNHLDDIAGMEAVLAEALSYCESLDGAAAEACAAKIRSARVGLPEDPSRYPSLGELAERTTAYRGGLEVALGFLIGIRAEHRDEPHYQALRESIRTYMAEEILREAKLIHPAFEGRGPRR